MIRFVAADAVAARHCLEQGVIAALKRMLKKVFAHLAQQAQASISRFG